MQWILTTFYYVLMRVALRNKNSDIEANGPGKIARSLVQNVK